MEAQVWTLIGLFAASSFGSFFYLGNKIDALGARLDARIDRLDVKLDALAVDVRQQGAKLDDHLRWHAS